MSFRPGIDAEHAKALFDVIEKRYPGGMERLAQLQHLRIALDDKIAMAEQQAIPELHLMSSNRHLQFAVKKDGVEYRVCYKDDAINLIGDKEYRTLHNAAKARKKVLRREAMCGVLGALRVNKDKAAVDVVFLDSDLVDPEKFLAEDGREGEE